MGRISRINTLAGIDVTEALEWFVGDAVQLTGIVMTDQTVPQPQDLTGATMVAKAEFYTASVLETGGRAGGVTISDFERDESRADKDLVVVVDDDQAANTGAFEMLIPADFLPGDPPAANIDVGVPCALVYLQRQQGSNIRTVRFPVIFRRGLPA